MPQTSNTKTPPDLLTKWTALALALALAVPIIVGRHNQLEAVSIAALLAALAGAWPVDRVEGRKRAIFGTATWVLVTYIVAVAWPWGHWYALLPVALVPYGIIVIGAGRGDPRRLVAKVDASVPAVIRQQLPAGAKVEPNAKVGNGKIRYRIKAGTDTPKNSMGGLDLKVATALKRPRGDVRLVDLGDTQAGLFELVLSEERPFAIDTPTKPDEWPLGSFPLGWNGEGDIVWVSSGLHGIVAGETGSGKSNTLNVIIEAAYRHDRTLVLIDPKQTELYPWAAHALTYADEPASILAALRHVEKMSAERRQWLRTQNRKEWRATDGPLVTVVIDEMSELARICPDAMPLCESLARLSRSAGFQCWFADQYPTAEVFPQVVKQNTPIVIGHRVKNGTAERVVLGEDASKEGWKISGPLPVGRAVVDLPGIGKQWVQVFPEDGVPPADDIAPSTPSTHPTSTPPTQGVHGGQDTGQWTVDTTELDTPAPKPYKHDQAIEDALTGTPQSARDLAREVGCSPTTATQALARIAAKGRAKAVGDGWVCPYLHELT